MLKTLYRSLNKTKTNKRGYTLIEIAVGLGITGFLAGTIGLLTYTVMNNRAKVGILETHYRDFQTGITLKVNDLTTKQFPAESGTNGFDTTAYDSYLESRLLTGTADPWTHAYKYAVSADGKWAVVYSEGRDDSTAGTITIDNSGTTQEGGAAPGSDDYYLVMRIGTDGQVTRDESKSKTK